MVTKKAQNLDGFTISVKPQALPNEMPKPSSLPSTGHGATSLPVTAPKPDKMMDDDMLMLVEEEPVVFTVPSLPKLPGSLNQDDLEPEPEIEVEDDDIVVENDPLAWTVETFPDWIVGMWNNIPKHSGYELSGLERAIAYLEFLKKECSKAARTDIHGKIPIDVLEKIRDEISDGIERLYERLEAIETKKNPGKRKKKADDSSDMVKEGGSANITGISVTVPLFISHLARTCINSMVSAGKDIEVVFDKLAKDWDLTKREEAETMQLLSDMGYAMSRRPRGYTRDTAIDFTSTDNNDLNANYPG